MVRSSFQLELRWATPYMQTKPLTTALTCVKRHKSVPDGVLRWFPWSSFHDNILNTRNKVRLTQTLTRSDPRTQALSCSGHHSSACLRCVVMIALEYNELASNCHSCGKQWALFLLLTIGFRDLMWRALKYSSFAAQNRWKYSIHVPFDLPWRDCLFCREIGTWFCACLGDWVRLFMVYLDLPWFWYLAS